MKEFKPGLHITAYTTCLRDMTPAVEQSAPKEPEPQVTEAIAAEWHSVKSGRDGVPYQLVNGLQDSAIPALVALAVYGLHLTGDISSSLAVAIIVPMALIALAALLLPWLKK